MRTIQLLIERKFKEKRYLFYKLENYNFKYNSKLKTDES